MDILDTKSRSSSIQIFRDMKTGFIRHYYSFMVFGCALTTVPAVHNLQQFRLTVGIGRCTKRESHKQKTRILKEIATILKEELHNAMSNLPPPPLKKSTACDGGHLTDIISRI
jgi:hypothetical protein